jgi:hypothetical protein
MQTRLQHDTVIDDRFDDDSAKSSGDRRNCTDLP